MQQVTTTVDQHFKTYDKDRLLSSATIDSSLK